MAKLACFEVDVQIDFVFTSEIGIPHVIRVRDCLPQRRTENSKHESSNHHCENAEDPNVTLALRSKTWGQLYLLGQVDRREG